MTKTTHVLAFTAGCVVGTFALAIVYAGLCFKSCENTHEDGGFECSCCKSHTDYKPNVPFNFCPICGAFVKRKERI